MSNPVRKVIVILSILEARSYNTYVTKLSSLMARCDMQNPVQSSLPEYEEYRNKQLQLEELERKLLDLECEHISLKHDLAAFEEKYLLIVGIKYAELDEILARVATLEHSFSPDEPHQDRARQARANAERSSEQVKKLDSKQNRSENQASVAEIKKLYREIAKRVHPDFASNDEERAKRTLLMSQVNQAYERGDDAELRRLLEMINNTPEEIVGEGIAFDLIRAIRKISRLQIRMTEVAKSIEQLKCEAAYLLKLRVETEAKRGHDLLEEMRLDVEEQILQAKLKLLFLLKKLQAQPHER